jgi:prepilin-type N-terminal cleavage/methylation domain-containing protein
VVFPLYKNNKKGFTLIELLVVVAIIGILASVILASLNSARAKGRDVKRISEVKQIQKALEFYYDKYGVYPNSGWIASCQAGWNSSLGVSLSEFLPTMPVDPTNDCAGYAYSGYKNYSYFATNYYPVDGKPGQWYMIVFTLEKQNLQLDAINSSADCVGNIRNYGGQDGYIITVAGNCVN